MKNADMRIYMGTITQLQIAEEMGFSNMTISRWFREREMDIVRHTRVKNAIDSIRAREQKERDDAMARVVAKEQEQQKELEASQQQRELQIGR